MSGTEGERVRERGFRHATKSGGPDSRILERPWRGHPQPYPPFLWMGGVFPHPPLLESFLGQIWSLGGDSGLPALVTTAVIA